MANQFGFVDVNQLQAETTLEAAAAKCGITLDVRGSGKEVRIDCPFHCVGDHAGRKEIAINVQNPQKVFMCHAYQCRFRGNLLTLMHGWVTGAKPTGGKLQGNEFQRVRNLLAGSERTTVSTTLRTSRVDHQANAAPRNIPFIESTDPRLRELHKIDEKFVVDIAHMSPAAAAYVQQHPCLSPESMRKWRCGYLPNDGGGDKRGWSLRGNFVYPVLSEAGQVLAWVKRNVHYETLEQEFGRLSTAERAGKSSPQRYHFPKGFERSTELFGQQRSRLREPGYREFISKNGIVVVEGMAAVIHLDRLGIPAVAIMSNRITDAQVEKVSGWAKQLANNQVMLMFDCDAPGTEGAKEAMWLFGERGVYVRLAWTSQIIQGAFAGRQPDSISEDEWRRLMAIE